METKKRKERKKERNQLTRNTLVGAKKLALALPHVLDFGHFQWRFNSRKDGRPQDEEKSIEGHEQQ